MKIYTKTGDQGLTGLYGGKRVSKSELRIESYGTVDELNSWLGLIASFDLKCIDRQLLHEVQSNLFNVGSLLASVPEKKAELPQLTEVAIQSLEKAIDSIDEQLPPLKTFILPGGSPESAQAQIARTVCRRAERLVVALDNESPVDPNIIMYLNRLSDFLFMLARMIMLEQGREEIPWKPQK